jgi:hypothetical protein
MDDQTTTNGAVSAEEAEADRYQILQAKIAAERRALSAVESRVTPSKIEQAEAELAALQRERADAETMEKLEAKYGKRGEKIASMSTPEGMIVIRRPELPIYKKFIDSMKPETGASVADQDHFVRSTLIHPSMDEFCRIRDALPGVLGVLTDLGLRLGGVKKVELQGK